MHVKRALLLYVLSIASASIIFTFTSDTTKSSAVFFLQNPAPDASGFDDTGHYLALADNILHGRGMSLRRAPPYTRAASHAPLYPGFIALMWQFGLFVKGTLLIQILWSSLSVPILYGITRRFTTERVAVLTAGIFAITPQHTTLSNSLLTEPVFLPLFLGSILLALQAAHRESVRRASVAGILFGLAGLVRPLVHPLIPFAFVWFLLYPNRASRAAMLKAGFAFAVMAYIVLAPWIIRNEWTFGHAFVSSASRYNFFRYNYSAFVAEDRGLPLGEARKIVIREFNAAHPEYGTLGLEDFRMPSIVYPASAYAIANIRPHWARYAILHIKHSIWFFQNNALIEPVIAWGVPKSWVFQDVSLRDLWAQGSILGFTRGFFSHPSIPIRYGVGAIYLVLVEMVGVLWSVRVIFNWQENPEVKARLTLLLVIIAYLAAATAFTYENRLTYPALPLFLTLAAAAWTQKSIHQNRERG